MLLVILGAGASYDSASDYPPNVSEEARPPLANQLFENRPTFRNELAKFSQCQPLVTRLHSPFPSLEEQLEVARSEAENHPIRYEQLAAIRFYIRNLIWQVEERWYKRHMGVTNHQTLLDDLERWRVKRGESIRIVTFNYDRMIESALPVTGIKCDRLVDYIADDRYKLFKIHGSVNWARPVDGLFHGKQNDQITHELIRNARTLRFLPGIEMISQVQIASRAGEGDSSLGLFPAIAIPVVQKNEFECPDSHIVALRESIPKVTKILSIGWRGTEGHFLKLLKDNYKLVPARAMVVAGSDKDADMVASKLTTEDFAQRFTKSGLGFSQALIKGAINEFLWQS